MIFWWSVSMCSSMVISEYSLTAVMVVILYFLWLAFFCLLTFFILFRNSRNFEIFIVMFVLWSFCYCDRFCQCDLCASIVKVSFSILFWPLFISSHNHGFTIFIFFILSSYFHKSLLVEMFRCFVPERFHLEVFRSFCSLSFNNNWSDYFDNY